MGDFNARYVSLLAEVMPLILPGKSMLKPANPDESTSMIFDHSASLSELPPDLRPRRFAHELGRGQHHRANYVAVTFGGWGFALPKITEEFSEDAKGIAARFSAELPTKARPNPGLVMFCVTEPVDNQGDFDVQKEKLVLGIKRAGELRQWLLSNQVTLRRWKETIDRYRI